MSKRYIFFTFRPQVNDQDLFEDFLKLFIPFVKSHELYAYSVENDSSLSRHIHCMMLGKYADKDKFFQKFNKTNGLADFKAICKKYTNTDENGFDTQLVPDSINDKLHVLGYVVKELNDGRGGYNMKDETITEAYEYYHAHKRIQAKKDVNTDWKILTPKNAHAHIEKFVDDNEIKLPYKLLGLAMTKAKYSFASLNARQSALIQAEIAVSRHKNGYYISPDDATAEGIVKSHTNNTPEGQDDFDFHTKYWEMKSERDECKQQIAQALVDHSRVYEELQRTKLELEKLKKLIKE